MALEPRCLWIYLSRKGSLTSAHIRLTKSGFFDSAVVFFNNCDTSWFKALSCFENNMRPFGFLFYGSVLLLAESRTANYGFWIFSRNFYWDFRYL